VKPGGLLVYAVCSLEKEEGEQVADWFASAHADFAPAAAPGALPGVQPDGRIRITPATLADAGGADGFFVAMFHRKDEQAPAVG